MWRLHWAYRLSTESHSQFQAGPVGTEQIKKKKKKDQGHIFWAI